VIPAYVMGVFKQPFSVCDELTYIYSWLLVGSWTREAKNILGQLNTMSWSKVQGGMGFCDMRLFNQALLACQVCRLISCPDNVCA
jgi:hypothetical protein